MRTIKKSSPGTRTKLLMKMIVEIRNLRLLRPILAVDLGVLAEVDIVAVPGRTGKST